MGCQQEAPENGKQLLKIPPFKVMLPEAFQFQCWAGPVEPLKVSAKGQIELDRIIRIVWSFSRHRKGQNMFAPLTQEAPRGLLQQRLLALEEGLHHLKEPPVAGFAEKFTLLVVFGDFRHSVLLHCFVLDS